MRYLYQQLLAFWTIIIIVMLIIGFSFTQLTRTTMEETNYQQLYSYLQSVERNIQAFQNTAETPGQNLKNALETTQVILGSQSVNLAFFGADGSVYYPLDTVNPVTSNLTEQEWLQLQDATTLRKTLSTNLYGEKETTSYIYRTATLNDEFYGVLVIAQPARNLNESIQAINSNLIKGFIVSSIIALVISYFFAHFQVKRINSMKEATKQIADGNFDIQIPNQRKDEFDELAQDFNKMAASLKESNEEIERQEERRKQFMADASHEMRTPLTTIKGLLEGLEYNAIPENQKENAIRLMQNETERLIRLVNENLDYEKIRTNQISIVVKKFSATDTLKRILTQLQSKAAAANDTFELLTTEDIEVYADYDRFTQVMVNILQNSIQFTKNGLITVKIEKGYLETIITISDTGIGMSKEQLANIWERYYKADPSRKSTKYGESGLGLSIVQQLVKMHNGKISVNSEVDKGTTFRISFPDIEITDKPENDANK